MAEEEKKQYPKPSILQNFISYSYYHILVACDSHATANELSINSELIRYKRIIYDNTAAVNSAVAGAKASGTTLSKVPLTGEYYADKYSPRSIGTGRYITLIDGSEDADFVIQAAKWATVFIPDTETFEGESYASTMELDGELTIYEPNGVNFLNVLSQQVCDCLHTDPNGIVFLLKTIFVGHTDSGTTETITTVRPLHFMMIDISADIDQSGALYTVSFVGNENGAGKLQSVTAVANEVNVCITKNMSLEDAMTAYATALNTQYTKKMEEVAKDLQIPPEDIKQQYRLCVYNIELDVTTDENKKTVGDRYDDSYVITNMENIRTHNKDGDPVITTGSSTGIEEMIDRIMMSCEQVIIDGTPENDPNDTKKVFPRKAYKIVSQVESDADVFTITYRIVKITAPISDGNAIVAGGDLNPDHDSQVMQFDYIFTGKNTDILDFKINMNMGMAFFQTMQTSNNVSDQESEVKPEAQLDKILKGKGDVNVAKSGASSGCNDPGNTRTGRYLTPLFLGSQVKSAIARNNKKPMSSASFRELMNRWASYENLEATMVIRGTVELLDQVLSKPSDRAPADLNVNSTVGEINKAGRHQFIDKDDEFGIREQQSIVAYAPNFIKLNIQMPATNDMYPQYTDFWYQGFFMLLSVNNVFDRGVYTQELEMFSIPEVLPGHTVADSTEKPSQSSKSKSSGGDTGSGETARKEQTSKCAGEVVSEQSTAAKNNASKKDKAS